MKPARERALLYIHQLACSVGSCLSKLDAVRRRCRCLRYSIAKCWPGCRRCENGQSDECGHSFGLQVGISSLCASRLLNSSSVTLRSCRGQALWIMMLGTKEARSSQDYNSRSDAAGYNVKIRTWPYYTAFSLLLAFGISELGLLAYIIQCAHMMHRMHSRQRSKLTGVKRDAVSSQPTMRRLRLSVALDEACSNGPSSPPSSRS